MSKVSRNNKAGPGILLGATLNKTKQNKCLMLETQQAIKPQSCMNP